MKKTIITIAVTVCVMSILFGGIIWGMSRNYETELTVLEDSYSNREDYFLDEHMELVEKYSNLKNDMESLEAEVYEMMNGNNYYISIEHEGETHVYTKEKENWLFSKKSHTVY